MSAAVLDVARHCQLSPGIVNRVLSACQSDISDETRESVLAAARELGCEVSPGPSVWACCLWMRAPRA